MGRRSFHARRGAGYLPRLAVFAWLACLPASAGRASPGIPADDAVVLEQLPDGRDAAARALRRQHAALAANPADLKLALEVARQDIELSRSLADPRWLGRADAALAPWPWVPGQPVSQRMPPRVLLLRAVILQSNHDFTGALAALDAVLARESSNAQAYLTRASIEQVQGRYDATLADCGQFANETLGLAPDTCTAAAMSLAGRAPLALKAITLSLEQYPDQQPGVRLWALTLAAEIAARLDDPSAEARFHAALALDGSDAYLLGAWSDWLLDHGRAGEVAALLRDRTRVDPLLLRLAIAEQALGRPEAAGHVADLEARFDASRMRGDSIHRREEARFRLQLLHQPDQALALARANWDVQREPADARVLLEAALAAHRPEAAAPVLAWVARNGVEDATLRALENKVKQ